MVCAIGSIAKCGGSIRVRLIVARATQQTVVVIDEIRVPVVDALVIRHVGIGRVDADALGDDFLQRPAGADQVVIDVAGAFWSRIRQRSSSLSYRPGYFAAAPLAGDVRIHPWFPPTASSISPILRLQAGGDNHRAGSRGR